MITISTDNFLKFISFIILKSFTAIKSDVELYNEIVWVVILGLGSYINKTLYNKYLNVVSQIGILKGPEKDKWDSWVLGTGLNSKVEREESKKEIVWGVDLDVDRVKRRSEN